MLNGPLTQRRRPILDSAQNEPPTPRDFVKPGAIQPSTPRDFDQPGAVPDRIAGCGRPGERTLVRDLGKRYPLPVRGPAQPSIPFDFALPGAVPDRIAGCGCLGDAFASAAVRRINRWLRKEGGPVGRESGLVKAVPTYSTHKSSR